MAVHIVYETHSLTEDNENGIATGWLPGRLSEQGRRFAAELGARNRDTGLAAVFVSDLYRAVETAQIAFADTTITIRQDPRLRECDYGELKAARSPSWPPDARNTSTIPTPAARATARSSRPHASSCTTWLPGGKVGASC